MPDDTRARYINPYTDFGPAGPHLPEVVRTGRDSEVLRMLNAHTAM